MKIRNAIPKVFYGLHFQEGVAQYKDLDGEPMIYINGNTAKEMDRSYQGKPVYVLHTDEVELDNVQEADGVVIRSFYNKCDGNHWTEFIVYTKEAQDCIEKKMWKLSNAYEVKETRGSGSWHGVDYDYEVAIGEYEHLAIVPNPRYADSIILNAGDFKQYNLDKEADLVRLANSKGKKSMSTPSKKKTPKKSIFSLFKKEKVVNSDELAQMSVTLPKSKVEKTITQLVNEADEKEESKGIANMEDMVKLENGEEISVESLLNSYKENEYEEDDSELENEDDEEDDVENEEDDSELENEEDDSELENEEDDSEVENEDEDDVENEEDEDEEEIPAKKMQKKKNSKKKAVKKNSKKVAKKTSKKKLSNAQKIANAKEKARVAAENYAKLANAGPSKSAVANSVDLGEDKVARGNKNYGS